MTKLKKQTCILFVTIVFGIMGGVISASGIHIPLWPQGGYKEMMAVFFLGMGYMLRKQMWWRSNKWIFAFIAIIPLSLFIKPTELNANSTFVMWLLIPFTGLAGYGLVYRISNALAQHQGKTKLILAHIGQKTFYIMTFHFLMFKPASLLKAYIFDMDWKVIGCHPVIPPNDDKWYWMVYSFTSIILSLALAQLVKHIPSPKCLICLK